MEKEIQISENKVLKIVHDEIAESPREWDNLSQMVCFHRRYDLGDNHSYKPSDYNSYKELKQQLMKDYDIAVILPLYLYDHGGITISTTPFSCRWDSGQVGYIFVTKQAIRENWSIKNVTKKYRDHAEKIMLAEVETYDQYLTGDVYGFQLIEKTTCDLGCEHEEIIDSCYGFYGDNPLENGMTDYLPEEVVEALKEEYGVKEVA